MFKKRETVVQNITYLALMAAINVIFVLLTGLLPPLMFILVFILPLTNTVVTIFCKKRYFPIYMIVTVLLCLLTSYGLHTLDTFFYVIPSIITGFIFGIMIEKKVCAIHIFAATTVAQYLLTFLTFLIAGIIVPDGNFFNVFFNMFGLNEFVFKEVFAHVFCFLLASIQMIFTYIVVKFEIRKLGYQINLNESIYYLSNIISLLMVFIAIGMYFLYAPLVYIFIFVSIIYTVYQMIELIATKKKLWILLLVGIIIISAFLFALLYQYPVKPLSIVLLSIPLGLINIVHFTNNYLINKQSCVK